MSGLNRSVAVACIVAFPLVAQGHGFGLYRPRSTVAYYYPVPVTYVPVLMYEAVPVCIAPVPSALGRAYAQPTPAPPSAGPTTAEPPLAAPSAPAKPTPAPPGRGP